VPFLLAVVDDLFFSVQITDMAKRAGLPVHYTRNVADTLARAAEGPSLVLIDLNVKHVDTVALIQELKAAHPHLPVAAYVSHVQTELRQAAATAGADPVLPRSAFASKVPALLLAAAMST
jgi:CheY-like chemotaxis protein